MNKRNPNWQTIVNDLLKKQNQTELAKKLGVAQQQISNLKIGSRGKNIGYTLGYDLLELHSKLKK